MNLHSVGTPALWLGFGAVIAVFLVIDLRAFRRKESAVRFREAAAWTAAAVALAAGFGAFIAHAISVEKALEFAAGYVVEEALSVDNLFVFLVIFRSFAVPAGQQHRVLFWGILGALLLRATFIMLGAALVSAFHWVMYVFGAILVITAIRLLFQGEENPTPEHSPVVRFFQRTVPVTRGYRGSHFFVVENGKRMATPLFLVLLTVEVSDLLFAVDSIPAVFGVSQDPFIVYTSNIFAILGLRSLYFLLAGVMQRFEYLKFGLAAVLAFVGAKLLLADAYPISIQVSLAVIAVVLSFSIAVSLIATRNAAPSANSDDGGGPALERPGPPSVS